MGARGVALRSEDTSALEAFVRAGSACALLREHCPDIKVRFINVVDLFTLVPREEHPHGLTDRDFDTTNYYANTGPDPTIAVQGNNTTVGKGDIKRAGRDCTIVAVSRGVHWALEAAEQLAKDGIDCEVIDPRTLVPFDWDAVAKSVSKTGRLVAVDPNRETCGAASEIITQAVERCWSQLKAQPQRVTWPNVPMPYSPPLEKAVVSDLDDIRRAIELTLKS